MGWWLLHRNDDKVQPGSMIVQMKKVREYQSNRYLQVCKYNYKCLWIAYFGLVPIKSSKSRAHESCSQTFFNECWDACLGSFVFFLTFSRLQCLRRLAYCVPQQILLLWYPTRKSYLRFWLRIGDEHPYWQFCTGYSNSKQTIRYGWISSGPEMLL